MRTLAVFASVFLVACGGEDDSLVCNQGDRVGTYLAVFSERNMPLPCGPLPDQLGRIDSQDLPDGCVFDASDRWTENDCKLERAYTCESDDIGPGYTTEWIAVTTQDNSSGSRISGVVTIRALDASGVALCASTYDVVATRQ